MASKSQLFVHSSVPVEFSPLQMAWCLTITYGHTAGVCNVFPSAFSRCHKYVCPLWKYITGTGVWNVAVPVKNANYLILQNYIAILIYNKNNTFATDIIPGPGQNPATFSYPAAISGPNRIWPPDMRPDLTIFWHVCLTVSLHTSSVFLQIRQFAPL